MHLIGKSLVMRTRVPTGSALVETPEQKRNPPPTSGSTSNEYGCNSEVLGRSASRGGCRGGSPCPPDFAEQPTFSTASFSARPYSTSAIAGISAETRAKANPNASAIWSSSTTSLKARFWSSNAAVSSS